jgi:predicted NAD/FAD-dependent oxidoreductase
MNPPSAAVIGAGIAGIARVQWLAAGTRHPGYPGPGNPAGIGSCGDWCLDAIAEPALLSGDAIHGLVR